MDLDTVLNAFWRFFSSDDHRFADGLKLADKAVREKEKRDSEMEAE